MARRKLDLLGIYEHRVCLHLDVYLHFNLGAGRAGFRGCTPGPAP